MTVDLQDIHNKALMSMPEAISLLSHRPPLMLSYIIQPCQALVQEARTSSALDVMICWAFNLYVNACRSLFLQDRRSECVDSLQWLRGPWTDIGLEYIELSDALEDRCKKDCGGQEREIFQWMDDALDRYLRVSFLCM